MGNFSMSVQRYGESLGKTEGKAELILSMMRTQGFDAETAMSFAGVDEEERPILAALIPEELASQSV